jgi:predicted Rdx family selenoprotein
MQNQERDGVKLMGWVPDFRSEDESSVQSAVFQALGTASVCWETLAGAGVFDSTRCQDVGYGLVGWIHDFLVNTLKEDLDSVIEIASNATAFDADSPEAQAWRNKQSGYQMAIDALEQIWRWGEPNGGSATPD